MLEINLDITACKNQFKRLLLISSIKDVKINLIFTNLLLT